MKNQIRMYSIVFSLVVSGLLLLPLPGAVAQETASEQAAQEGSMSMHGMTGQDKPKSMMPCMHKHSQMMAKRQEMLTALQQQMTALREHTTAMETITDHTALLTEMKKHQHMSDALLGTMIEQRVKMHESMQAHHGQMREHMEKKGQSEAQKPGCCGNAEASAEQEENASQDHEAHHRSD